MPSILNGIRRFRAEAFENQRECFRKLSGGRHPEPRFITDSDSRPVANTVTPANPGELLVLRSAGNTVPPHGAGYDGEAVTREYALDATPK